MILMFLSAFLLIFSAQFFSINYSIQGLERAIINAPIELFMSVIEVKDDQIIYNKENLENSFLSYYSKSISRYSKKYSVEFYYYNIEDGSMCITENCNAVEVSINCKLILNKEYMRTMYYQLKRSSNG